MADNGEGGAVMADETVNAEDKLKPLEWAVPAPDLKPPVKLQDLLLALQFLGDDKQRAEAAGNSWDAKTPGSIQVIKSGAMGITVWWARLTRWVAGGGGVVAILGTAAGAITDVRAALGEPLIVALVAGGAIVTAAALLSVALLIKGDLEARGAATAARYSGRAEVAAAFLTGTAALPSRAEGQAMGAELTAALAGGRPVFVQFGDGRDAQRLAALSRATNGEFQVHLGMGQPRPINEVISYRIEAPEVTAGPSVNGGSEVGKTASGARPARKG